MAKILMPLPARDFDPTETGVPWRVLTERGHDVVFATPRMASIEIGGGANRIRLIVAVHAEIVPSVSVDHAIVPTVAVSATVIE